MSNSCKKMGSTPMILVKNIKKEFYQRSGDSASSNNDDKHNHTIDEVVRKLYCAVHDKPYKARKFVPRQTSDMADDGI